MAAVAILAGAAGAGAAVKTEDVRYKVGDTEFHGFLAYDDAATDKRPGVLVAPEWWGLNDYAKGRAKQLAGLGYVALAMDPYGGGKIAADPNEAGTWAGALKKDPKTLRERAGAALDLLKKNEHVDPSKVAAIGYCFGGTTVLELARGGADLAGVVTFHGALATPEPAEKGKIKAQLLIEHGGDDPFVPPEECRVLEGDAGRRREVPDQRLQRGRPQLHQPRGGQAEHEGGRLQRHGRQAVVGGDEGVLRRNLRQVRRDRHQVRIRWT